MWLNFTLVPAEEGPYCQSVRVREGTGGWKAGSGRSSDLWFLTGKWWQDPHEAPQWSSGRWFFFLYHLISWHASTSNQHSSESSVQTQILWLANNRGKHTREGSAGTQGAGIVLLHGATLEHYLLGWNWEQSDSTSQNLRRCKQFNTTSTAHVLWFISIPRLHLVSHQNPAPKPRAATKMNSALNPELRTLTKTAANSLNLSKFSPKKISFHEPAQLWWLSFQFSPKVTSWRFLHKQYPQLFYLLQSCSALAAHTGLFSCPSTFPAGFTKQQKMFFAPISPKSGDCFEISEKWKKFSWMFHFWYALKIWAQVFRSFQIPYLLLRPLLLFENVNTGLRTTW